MTCIKCKHCGEPMFDNGTVGVHIRFVNGALLQSQWCDDSKKVFAEPEFAPSPATKHTMQGGNWGDPFVCTGCRFSTRSLEEAVNHGANGGAPSPATKETPDYSAILYGSQGPAREETREKFEEFARTKGWMVMSRYTGTHFAITYENGLTEQAWKDFQYAFDAGAKSVVAAPQLENQRGDVMREAAQIAQRFSEASEPGPGVTVALAIRAECNRRAGAAALPSSQNAGFDLESKTPAGLPLTIGVEGDQLVIRIGVDTLAFCFEVSDDNHSHDDSINDFRRSWKVTDKYAFAKGVGIGLRDEEEDGSTSLNNVLDAACLAAVEDDMGVEADGRVVTNEMLHPELPSPPVPSKEPK